jgi:arylsulfatase A-like enzyme
MPPGRPHRAGLALAVLCVFIAIFAAEPASAASTTKCDKACQKRQKRAKLRRENKKQQRLNVILIDTDDMNVADLFVMRNTLSLLGAKGTSFRNSYASLPLCCPSRATQLTGQYAHNHGVITDQQYGQLDNSNTLAVWLQRAKYRTAMVGKYLNGYGVVNRREVPPGWTEWYGLTGGSDQHRYGFKLNENGKVRHYGRSARNYIDYVLGSKANDVLKRWAISPRPFFLYYNPTNPHGESGTPFWSTRDPEPAPQYLGAFGDITAPRSPNFDEPNVSDKPQMIRDIPRFSDVQLADLDRRYRGRLESLLSVDDEIARLVNLVRKYGDKRKTVFIFTSDNGLELGSHRIFFKNFLYEEGERVPLIIRGPGFPQNAVREQLVANIDLAPTITELTRTLPGRTVDGISLVPLANDPSQAANRDLLFESPDVGAYGIRRGPWKYNLWDTGEEELYNLDEDPYELTSLHKDPSLATLRAELRARLLQLRTCAGASCR